jgi:hypothetical protein
MSQRTILINISGSDPERIIAQFKRYQSWPAWRRWMWRKGLIG